VRRLVRNLVVLGGLALLLPGAASAADFDPSKEFELKPWISIHAGPLDLSINKAVVYLFMAAGLSCLFGIVFMRVKFSKTPGRRETIGELVYELAQTQVAELGLPARALPLWFPYCATMLIFIWFINMLGFVPLPLTGETWHGIPVWGIYAATSSLSVTLALAFVTWIATHVEGIRWNGPVKYFKSWIPEVPKAILPLIVFIEILSQFMRLISLSVRLYANMLAGHILILTFIGLIFVFESYGLIVLTGISAGFYIFEVGLIASIQAFIFAALSAIYIGAAIEPDH
jgi:F-type H+-transporting ATPase subunit a